MWNCVQLPGLDDAAATRTARSISIWDNRIELELRADQKEMAEHLMLVDLARNDLAKICRPGTRHIAQLLKVDRYSHVMPPRFASEGQVT